MTPEEHARDSWQSAPAAGAIPSIEALRARSSRFRRRIARRNAIEYAAGALVIAVFGAYVVFGPGLPLKVASAMLVAATVYVLWQLHRRASALPDEGARGRMPLLEYQRAELVRQRDALDTVFSWYLAPFIPGMLLFFTGPLLMTPIDAWVMPPLRVIGSLAVIAGVFTGIWYLNKVAARHLARKIEDIDRLLAD